jgi:uncharacterized protein (TIGR00255 family)
MNIFSMTGFSSTVLVIPLKHKETGIERHIHLSITLKTLNSRFFEVTCKLPYSLSFLETELIRFFKPKLHRGSVQFIIHMSDPAALTGTIEPALATVKSYLGALKKTQEFFDIPGDLTINDLIHLPNIFETREEPLDPFITEKIWQTISALTDSCNHVRKKEGNSLAQDLQQRIEVIRKNMLELEPRAAQSLEEKRKQLLSSLQQLLTETQQELAAENQLALVFHQLEKMDIHEEITRFKTHLASLEAILSSDDIEKGKKIDFTLQELFREINTTTSKCNDAQVSGFAINIKVELEKAREQAQNIV